MRLANRRFVPIFFDLSNRGAAADPGARAFVVKAKQVLGGRSVPTPPVLFMTPEGKLLDEISNYASANEVLDKMQAVLAANPAFDKPSVAEAAVKTPLEQAWIQFDLVDYDSAMELLVGVKGDAADFLRAHIARRRGQWDLMALSLASIGEPKLAPDVRMERAYPLWDEQAWSALEKHLTDFPKDSGRYTEARYVLGIAKYHQGDKEAAIEIWKSTIEACAQDPWIYRADWAYSNARSSGKQQVFSTRGPKTSLLKRHGYMGNRNPDLATTKPKAVPVTGDE